MNYKTDINALLKKLNSKPVNADKPVSENTDKETAELFGYLKSIYGKKFISGQQYLQDAELEDLVYFKNTGKLPAIRGYDLMDMDKEKGDRQLERAIKWAKQTGCIITMCWHWYAPDNMNALNECCWSFYYKTTSYDHKTSFDIVKAVNEGTPEYDFIINRIDKAAIMLKEFQNEHIPVLWRPLHEANGNWFWWGNRGNDGGESAEAYKKLWYIMFDRLENYHKLTNLIWVWNGQSKEMQVNPNTFDIVGDDIYSERENDHSAQAERFSLMKSMSHGKMITMSECGYVPDAEQMRQEKVNWLWWLPWWGQFVYKTKGWRADLTEGLPVANEERFPAEFMKKLFNDKDVITLSDLPTFKKFCPDGLEEKFK